MSAKQLSGNKKKLTALLFLLPFFTYAFTPTPVFSWAKKCSGSSQELGTSIVPDGSGNTYVVGYFGGTVDFDPGPATVNLISTGGTDDIFIAKYDFNGNYVWAKKFGNAGTDRALSVATDVEANVYVCGSFEGTVYFDPVVPLVSAGSSDAFILKLDMNGNYRVAHSFGSTSADKATSVTLDWDLHICLTGTFQGSCDFNPGPGITTLVSSGLEDIFLTRLHADPSYTYLISDFAVRIGGPGSDVSSSVKTDIGLCVIVTGSYSSTVDFDPGAGIQSRTSSGSTDIFIAKYTAGGLYVWAIGMGGTLTDNGKSVTVDADGNVYSTGSFTGTVDFNPDTGISNLTSVTSRAIFIHKLTVSGTFLWAKQISATNDQYSYSIALNGDRFVTIAGYFNGTGDFDPGPGTQNLTSSGIDIFIDQLDQNGNYLWAGKLGGAGTDLVSGLAIDGGNNFFLTGSFTGTCDFDASTSIYNLPANGSSSDIYFTKYNQAPAQPTASGCLPLTLSQNRLSSVSVAPVNNSAHKPGYQLIFNDEFNSTSLNTNLWIQKSFASNSNELAYYKTDAAGAPNAYTYGTAPVDYLSINANYEPNYIGSGKNYTSGWMEAVRQFKHGYFEIKAKMPAASSTWTSFWLYGNDFDELDILEIVSDGVGANNELTTTYHWRDHGYPKQPTYFSSYPTPSWQGNGLVTFNNGYDFATAFHTFAMEWAPGRLDFYLDNILVNSVQNDCNVSENLMTLIVALAMGQYTANPANFSPNPQSYVIDYVRIYKKIWVENFGAVAGGYGAEHPRMMADVNGDGKDDIVAFGGAGVYVSKANVNAQGLTTFSAPQLWIGYYGYDNAAGQWRVANHVRTTADVNGDGKADIVGFGENGVYVSLSTGSSFGTQSIWVANFGHIAGGWDVAYNPRFMADVNADGKADVVGFGGSSVWVSTSTGTTFNSPTAWSSDYCIGSSSGSWQVNMHPRFLRDINGDGKADIVGFGENGVFVSTAGTASFGSYNFILNYFGAATSAGSWSTSNHVRTLADVNGDQYPDAVGFYNDGIHVSLANGTGGLMGQTLWSGDFGSSAGWLPGTRPRMMADINGDGMDDAVGFGGPGVFVALSTGFSFSPSQQWTDFYGADAVGGSFTVANNPRMTADVNGDCRKDIVAFGDSGVFVTLSPLCSSYAFRISHESVVNSETGAPLNITVFPNPTTGIVNVASGGKAISSMQIIDIVGNIIYEDNSGNSSIEVDMSNHADGMYIVRCVINGEIRTAKFLKR